MIRRLLYQILFITLTLSSLSSAQDIPFFKHSIPEKIDPLDVNLRAIKKLIEGKIKINDKKFSDGYILQAADTIKCGIYTDKSLFRPFLFIITKWNDSLFVYTPYDIKGYSVNETRYIRHTSFSNNFKNLFFLKEIDKGRINLYENKGVSSDPHHIFYLSKDNNRTFYMVNPDIKTVSIDEQRSIDETNSKGYNDNIMFYNTAAISEKFQSAMMNFIKDCEMVRNKIKQEIYTITDIERIIKDYNRCFVN